MSSYTRSLSASLIATGSFTEQTRKHLLGYISLSGSLSRNIRIVLTALVSFVGQVSRVVRIRRIAILSYIGGINRQTHAILTKGAIGYHSAISRRSAHRLLGGVSFTGSKTYTHKFATQLTAAGLGFVGSVKRKSGKRLIGSALRASGQIFRSTNQRLVGTLRPHGVIKRRITALLPTAHLTLIGQTLKRGAIGVALNAALGFSGAYTEHRARYGVAQNASLLSSGRLEALGVVDIIYQPDPDTYLGVYPDELLMQMPDLQFQLVEAPSRVGVLQPHDPWRTK